LALKGHKCDILTVPLTQKHDILTVDLTQTRHFNCGLNQIISNDILTLALSQKDDILTLALKDHKCDILIVGLAMRHFNCGLKLDFLVKLQMDKHDILTVHLTQKHDILTLVLTRKRRHFN
jgi:hypothetical protein